IVKSLDRQSLCDRAGAECTSSTAPELRMGRAGVFFRARPKLIEKVHRLSSCLVLPAEGASDGRGVLGMVRHRFVALEGGKLGLARLPAAGPGRAVGVTHVLAGVALALSGHRLSSCPARPSRPDRYTVATPIAGRKQKSTRSVDFL